MMLTFMLIPLAVTLGIAYWVLIAASKQECKTLSITGLILGWLLIVLALIITVQGIFFRPMMPHAGMPAMSGMEMEMEMKMNKPMDIDEHIHQMHSPNASNAQRMHLNDEHFEHHKNAHYEHFDTDKKAGMDSQKPTKEENED